MRSLIFLAALLGFSSATTGFDAADPITVSKFQCMKSNGHSFYIARVFRSNGLIDSTGIDNMENAWTGGMTHVDGYIFPCVTCAESPADQAQAAVMAVRNSKCGMLWIDVEVYKWSSNIQDNRQFIAQMGYALTTMQVKWGIRTNYNNWKTIVGLDWTNMSTQSLWWASNNKQANLNNFQPFGGWTKPSINEYSIGAAGPCGFVTNLNYYN